VVNILLKLGVNAAKLVGAGALVAFGWIFGEHGATKLVDSMETRNKGGDTKNENGTQ
jgi:hypothetical protein